MLGARLGGEIGVNCCKVIHPVDLHTVSRKKEEPYIGSNQFTRECVKRGIQFGDGGINYRVDIKA